MGHAAACHAFLRIQSEWWWDRSLEGGEVVGVDLCGEAQSGVNDGRVDAEEVLGDLAGTGILVAEARDEASGIAVVVELEVDASLREDGTLELGQSGVLLHNEVVLEDETGLEVVAFDEGQELARARVDMGSIKATGVHEANGCGEVGPNDRREVGTVGKVDLATSAGDGARVGWGVGCGVEVELQVGRVLSRKQFESFHLGGGGLDFLDEILRD